VLATVAPVVRALHASPALDAAWFQASTSRTGAFGSGDRRAEWLEHEARDLLRRGSASRTVRRCSPRMTSTTSGSAAFTGAKP